MASSEILLTGNLKVGGQAVQGAVYGFELKGSREVIERPATMDTGRKTPGAGSDMYEITLNYVSDVSATTKLGLILWEAVNASTGDGTVTYEGTLYPGAVSATNPQFFGSFIATGVKLGGTVGQYMTDQQTYRCTDRPGKRIAPV